MAAFMGMAGGAASTAGAAKGAQGMASGGGLLSQGAKDGIMQDSMMESMGGASQGGGYMDSARKSPAVDMSKSSSMGQLRGLLNQNDRQQKYQRGPSQSPQIGNGDPRAFLKSLLGG